MAISKIDDMGSNPIKRTIVNDDLDRTLRMASNAAYNSLWLLRKVAKETGKKK